MGTVISVVMLVIVMIAILKIDWEALFKKRFIEGKGDDDSNEPSVDPKESD